jgi:hypothetical protein
MSCFFFDLMNQNLFPFKGFDTRSLGPISCLVVPLGSVIQLRAVVLRDRFAATCFFSPSSTDCIAR